jgi:large subunit ribosomal protein L30
VTTTEKKLNITLVKSVIGASPAHRKIVEALGLRKIRHSVLQPDNPQIRGAIEKVRHLVQVQEL